MQHGSVCVSDRRNRLSLEARVEICMYTEAAQCHKIILFVQVCVAATA